MSNASLIPLPTKEIISIHVPDSPINKKVKFLLIWKTNNEKFISIIFKEK